MTASDASWLKFWEVFATIGFILVIIGVVIEGVEHFKKFSKRESARKLQIEKIGWLVLVAGLAMEFLGDHMAKRIADKENRRLTGEAAQARKQAGDAIERAGIVNQLAAESNERSKQLEAQNLVLRSNVAALEIKQQPRKITPTQVTNFIFLTERVAKIPIKICIGQEGEDTETYALQIRDMFNRAGFQTDPNAGAGGITRDPKLVMPRPIGATDEWPSIVFVRYGTNDNRGGQITIPSPPCEQTNGFNRPIIAENDTNKIFAALVLNFQQIGIFGLMIDSTNWVKPGEFAFLIPLKND